LSKTEARYLVAGYYNLQRLRIRADQQGGKLAEEDLPYQVINWLAQQSRVLEHQIRAALAQYASNHYYGKWPLSVVGIGPVITAGLISHTDIDHLPTAGHLWSFAGLDPTKVWNRREKRPWNADLKVLCWKIGQSFMKVQNRSGDVYGKAYKAKKEIYIQRNADGGFKENAKKALETRNWRKETEAYKAYSVGCLPPGHIDAMARRYATKLFLAHYWEVCWRLDHPGEKPVLPYPIVHLGHVHYIPPPNFS
jgi:hypothetical protein